MKTMKKQILTFVEKELKRLRIRYRKGGDEIIFRKGKLLECQFYVEEGGVTVLHFPKEGGRKKTLRHKNIVTVGIIYYNNAKRPPYAAVLHYNKTTKKVTKLRCVMPMVDTLKGIIADNLFMELLSILLYLCRTMFDSKIKLNIGSREALRKKK